MPSAGPQPASQVEITQLSRLRCRRLTLEIYSCVNSGSNIGLHSRLLDLHGCWGSSSNVRIDILTASVKHAHRGSYSAAAGLSLINPTTTAIPSSISFKSIRSPLGSAFHTTMTVAAPTVVHHTTQRPQLSCGGRCTKPPAAAPTALTTEEASSAHLTAPPAAPLQAYSSQLIL